MGYWLAIAGAVSAYSGYATNKSNQGANAESEAAAKKDYEERIKAAAKGAAELLNQYNEVVAERPSTTWDDFVKGYIRSIDDPQLREAYTNAKQEDFENLREFAKLSTEDNTDNLLSSFDKLTGGRGQEVLDKRVDLVMQADAQSRFQRAYELRAPVSTNAGSVKYDSKGNLIEGQRADKQTFSIANEVQTQVEQEQKADLAQLERDRLGAAESQKAKAGDFMQFFDPTGLSVALNTDRLRTENQYQLNDENRAFELYSAFAQAATGITPTTPRYLDPNAGNKQIADGTTQAAQGLAKYYSSTK